MRTRNLIFLVIVALAFSYFLFEARGVLFSPSLAVDEPRLGTVVRTSHIRVSGRTSASIDVWVNGQMSRSDQRGFFQGSVTLFPGYNPIEVRVRNRFGYERRAVSSVVLE